MMQRALAVVLVAGCYSPVPPAGAPCPDGVCPTGLVCAPATMTCEKPGTPMDGPEEPPFDTAPDSFVPIDGQQALYSYRRRITITNTSNATLPAQYTIRVPFSALPTLVTDGKIKSDLSDLRIMGDVGGERDRIVDRTPSFPAIIINFPLATSLAPGATTTDFAIYYGRPAAPAAPTNGNAVFPLFDDFNGTAVSNIWLTNDAPSVASGKLTLRANHTDAITTNAAADNVPLVSTIETSVAISDPQSEPTVQATGTFYYWFGFQRNGDFTATDPWAVWIARGKGQLHGEQKSPNGCDVSCDGPYINQDTAAHYYTIDRDTGESRYYRDGTLSYTATVQNTDLSPMFRNFAATSTMTVDFVRARARVSPEPTVSVGAEEAL